MFDHVISSLSIILRVYVALIVLTYGFFLSVAWYIIDMQRSLVLYDGMSHLSQEKMRCLSFVFTWYTHWS